MVRRNAREPFASALVFPGGVVEQDDYSDSWLAHLAGDESFDVDERASRIAACRETWEEVALLPGARGAPLSKAGANLEPLLDTVIRHGVRLALGELVKFAHWITPEVAPKRFDTYFYICRAPAAERAYCDGHETVALEWIQPLEAVAGAERGDRSFLLPTIESLKLLAESANCDAALTVARHRKIVPITPVGQPPVLI
ncbi:MAG: NUDIX hydrolase [Acidobacteriota bacterium]|nr:NUDIX hydrolase [Acidobacteriota bacterium]